MVMGCNMSQTTKDIDQADVNLKTTRLHIYGFKKTKSGAI